MSLRNKYLGFSKTASFKALVSLKRLTWISSFFTYQGFEPQILDFCKISWLFLQPWKIFNRKTWFTNTLTHGNMDLVSSEIASLRVKMSLKLLYWTKLFFNKFPWLLWNLMINFWKYRRFLIGKHDWLTPWPMGTWIW